MRTPQKRRRLRSLIESHIMGLRQRCNAESASACGKELSIRDHLS